MVSTRLQADYHFCFEDESLIWINVTELDYNHFASVSNFLIPGVVSLNHEVKVYEFREMTYWCLHAFNGCLGSGHHCIIWLCGCCCPQLLEKVIVFLVIVSSNYALRLCTMRIVGFNS